MISAHFYGSEGECDAPVAIDLVQNGEQWRNRTIVDARRGGRIW